MRVKNNTKLKAQQLVEFVLIAPIILVLIVFIIELGYAINIRSSLIDAVKMSIPTAAQAYKASLSSADKKTEFIDTLKTELQDYMVNNNLPYEDSITVEMADVSDTNKSAVVVSYQYKPFFTLPYGAQTNGYKFVTTQIISNTLLEGNTSPSTLTSNDLGSFWKTSSDLDGRRGIIRNNDITGMTADKVKKTIAFLVGFAPIYTPDDSSHTFARLINWWGEDLLPPNLFLDITSGNLVVYSRYYKTTAFDTGVPFAWVLSSLGFTQAIYTPNLAIIPIMSKNKLNLASPTALLNDGYTWCDQNATESGLCNDDVSLSTITNQSKMALGLNYSSFTVADGGYDNIIDNTGSKLSSSNAKNYTFYNSSPTGSEYLLKLFVPNNNFPSPTNGIYQFGFKIDTNGKYSSSGTATDIVDVIFDSDADGIPNAWDKHPTNIDINANGTLDGSETSAITANNAIADSFTGTSYSWGGYNYAVQTPALTNVYGILPYGKTPSSIILNTTIGKTYLPDAFNPLNLIDNAYTVKITGAATLTTIYFKNGSNYYRKLNINPWNAATATADKATFLNGTLSGSDIILKKSPELDIIESTTFGNKVVN